MIKEALKNILITVLIMIMIGVVVLMVDLLFPTKKCVPVNQISHFKCEAYDSKLICTLEKVTDEH